MTTFAFVARDSAGTLVRGALSANSPADAARQLRGEGKFPIKVEAAKGASPASNPAAPATAPRSGGAFKTDDVIHFAGQLTVLVETGVSLADALEACRSPGQSPLFARTLDDVIERVKGGSEFSAALGAHPRVFPPLFVAMVRASEASGTLPLMLQRVHEFLVTQRDLKKKIKGAVTYPIAMLLFAAGVTVFLLTYVLPKFAKIYAGREAALPQATRCLLAFSEGLKAYGLYILLALVPLIALAVWRLRRPESRSTLDAIRLRVPLIGPMFQEAYLARGLRTLGTMIQSGVVLLEGVELTRNACGSPRFEALWSEAAEALQQGKQLSDTFAEQPLVPRAVTQMVIAGERTGKLGPVLERVAAHCDAELAVALKTMTSMLEPIIIGILGTVVGGLVIALLLPIFTISRAMHP